MTEIRARRLDEPKWHPGHCAVAHGRSNPGFCCIPPRLLAGGWCAVDTARTLTEGRSVVA